MTIRRISKDAWKLDDLKPDGESLISSGFVYTFSGVNQFMDCLKWAYLDRNSIAAITFTHDVFAVAQEVSAQVLSMRNASAVTESDMALESHRVRNGKRSLESE